MTTTDSRPTSNTAMPIMRSSAGSDSLSGQGLYDTQRLSAAEGQTSPQAIAESGTIPASPAGTASSHGQSSCGTQDAPAVADYSLSGQKRHEAHQAPAAEGQDSPQAIVDATPKAVSPAGSKTSRSPSNADTHVAGAAAAHVPGGQDYTDAQLARAAEDLGAGRPATTPVATATVESSLTDPLLALAADVLDDLEKVRIANENRLRQLTRSAEDSDGETRGFGLDERHPDVARLASLVGMLAAAEHQAELNLARLMRKHPLGPWMKATAGIGEKQGARLLAAIGDPYIRPEITRADETVELSRPRLVSELWAYCGYHVVRTPVSGQQPVGTRSTTAADGPDFPADQGSADSRGQYVGGDQADHPGHCHLNAQAPSAGLAAKRQRGMHANWSATAKMRAYLVAVSCMKCLESPYRAVYEETRAKYASATHQVACVRCGPKGKPAEPGSPLSDGHKHARALRAVAKAVLRDLWREARRLHELPGGHPPLDSQKGSAAGISQTARTTEAA